MAAPAAHRLLANKAVLEEAKDHPQVTSAAADPSGVPRALGDFHVNTATRTLWVADTAVSWSALRHSTTFPRTTLTAPTYTAQPLDTWIGVNYDGEVTITLPSIASLGNDQMRISVADEGGHADALNKITLLPSGSDLIVGVVFYSIEAAFGSVALVATAAVTPHQWMIGTAH